MPQSETAVPVIGGDRKAAMFMTGVEDEIGVDVLRCLEPNEIRIISSKISALEAVQPDDMLNAFREFETLAANSQFFAKGGSECARRFVEQALGVEPARQILKFSPAAGQDRREFGILQDTDPQQLAGFIRDEHPQVIALILSNLPSPRAGALMAALPPDARPEVALRMAALDRISPQVSRHISEAIVCKLKTVRQLTRSDGRSFGQPLESHHFRVGG